MSRSQWNISGTKRERERFSFDKCALLLNVSAYSGIIHFQGRKVRSKENIDKDVLSFYEIIFIVLYNNI